MSEKLPKIKGAQKTTDDVTAKKMRRQLFFQPPSKVAPSEVAQYQTQLKKSYGRPQAPFKIAHICGRNTEILVPRRFVAKLTFIFLASLRVVIK